MNNLRPIATLMMLAGLVAGVASGAGTAWANPSSVYERINPVKCPIHSKDPEGRSETVRCAFKKGPPLLMEFHEHGVSIIPDMAHFGVTGPLDRNRFNYSQTGHFGSLSLNNKKQFTVEWRVKMEKGKWVPFAAIYRTDYNRARDDGKYDHLQRLEVMKFGADHACQIGTVEAREKNHNVKARKIADAAMDQNPC